MKTANSQNDGMTIENPATQAAAAQPRTLSVVAAELEDALAAQAKIPTLREELLTLTGRRRRNTDGEKKASATK